EGHEEDLDDGQQAAGGARALDHDDRVARGGLRPGLGLAREADGEARVSRLQRKLLRLSKLLGAARARAARRLDPPRVRSAARQLPRPHRRLAAAAVTPA